MSQSWSGERINFSHHGVVADVHLLESMSEDFQISSDTAGWEWYDLSTADYATLSALTQAVGITAE